MTVVSNQSFLRAKKKLARVCADYLKIRKHIKNGRNQKSNRSSLRCLFRAAHFLKQ